MNWLKRKLLKKLTIEELKAELMRRGFTAMDVDYTIGDTQYSMKAIGVREPLK